MLAYMFGPVSGLHHAPSKAFCLQWSSPPNQESSRVQSSYTFVFIVISLQLLFVKIQYLDKLNSYTYTNTCGFTVANMIHMHMSKFTLFLLSLAIQNGPMRLVFEVATLTRDKDMLIYFAWHVRFSLYDFH